LSEHRANSIAHDVKTYYLYLGVAVQLVMVRCSANVVFAAGQRTGAELFQELFRLLQQKVRVRPTPFRGRRFIGRDYHNIGDHSAVICTALVEKMSRAYLSVFKQVLTLRKRAEKHMKRATVLLPDEAMRFCADTAEKVRLLIAASHGYRNLPSFTS